MNERFEVREGDALELLAALDPESLDSLVTDPPYGIRFMGQAWDGAEIEHNFQADERRFAADEARGGIGKAGRKMSAYANRSNAGAYDFSPRGMLAFQEWTREWAGHALRALKPGGHLLSFSSARTYHRLTVGIEDAGFEIRDCLQWLYGSGFPKSLDVSKAIDKAAGAERKMVRARHGTSRPGFAGETYGDGERAPARAFADTAPETEDARRWAGWGTALKPAHEPIVLARKPLVGTVAANVLENGTGALNIGETRIGRSGGTTGGPSNDNWRPSGTNAEPSHVEIATIDAGRWPANVVLTHHPECRGFGEVPNTALCHPDCPARMLDEQAGERVAGSSPPKKGLGSDRVYGDAERSGVVGPRIQLDGGGTSRFFYCAKAQSRERIAGTLRNLHPTVKPVDLMRWLVRLVTPPDGLVLDPFLGSGSTGCACMVEGFRFLGFEREAEYAQIARERISDWAFAHPLAGSDGTR